jgi:hypothetical protein
MCVFFQQNQIQSGPFIVIFHKNVGRLVVYVWGKSEEIVKLNVFLEEHLPFYYIGVLNVSHF